MSAFVEYANTPNFVYYSYYTRKEKAHTCGIFRWRDHKVHGFPLVSAQTQFLLSPRTGHCTRLISIFVRDAFSQWLPFVHANQFKPNTESTKTKIKTWWITWNCQLTWNTFLSGLLPQIETSQHGRDNDALVHNIHGKRPGRCFRCVQLCNTQTKTNTHTASACKCPAGWYEECKQVRWGPMQANCQQQHPRTQSQADWLTNTNRSLLQTPWKHGKSGRLICTPLDLICTETCVQSCSVHYVTDEIIKHTVWS